jgi:hypothetical protein
VAGEFFLVRWMEYFLGQAPDGLHAGNKKPLPRVGKEGFL